jgi:outer membrane protein assembly factor BamB
LQKNRKYAKLFTIILIALFTITGTITVLPSVLAQEEFTLRVDEYGEGSVTVTPDQDTYPNGTIVTLEAIADASWKFASWEGEYLTGTTNPVNITMNEDKLIYATFSHDPPISRATYSYISASPRTVGVGEYTQIIYWLSQYPPTASGIQGDRWRNHYIDITKPDGTTTTMGPLESGSVGSGWFTYTPDQIGDYTFVHRFAGQELGRGIEPPNKRGIPYVGDYFEASTSETITLTVTEEPSEQWQEPPITDDYWERPLTTANRYWTSLTSNWLKGSWLQGDFQPYGIAPSTSHILWTRPVIAGGLIDESFAANHGQTTDYENFFTDPIIMNGKIYYNTGMHPEYGYYCIDLKTGEEIWFKNGTDNGLNNPFYLDNLGGGGDTGPYLAQRFLGLSFGQQYHYYSLNGEGVLSYLWMTRGSTWHMLDANSGNWVLSLVNVPGGTTITDQDGSILRFTYNRRTGNFLAWNTSQSIPPPCPTGTGQQQWEPRIGAVIDARHDTSWWDYGPSGPGVPGSPGASGSEWYSDDILPRSGYTMNCTGPTGLPGSIRVLQDENRVPKMIFGSSFEGYRFGSTEYPQQFYAWAVQINEHAEPYSPFPDKSFTQNTNLGYTVTLLWNKTIPYPAGGEQVWSLGATSYADGVFNIEAKETRQKWGYSLDTGNLLWGPTEPEDQWNMYGQSNDIAYGNLYGDGYAGKLYCYDMQTGERKWTYEAKGIGYESPYGDYPLSIGAIADGKVYLYSSEHSPTTPLWRGSYLRCVDAHTGEELWKCLNFVSGMAVADGCVVAGDWYDQRMYCYGKGPSATTVSTPQPVIQEGGSVMILGTVTDQSPGAKGTAAIADEHMDAWMEYLYKGQAKPATAVGVTVKLSAYDPNGNYQDIGTTTVDQHGKYGMSWVPPVPGDYYILAEFEGSESYGSSSDTTYITVDQAPQATPPPEATPPPASMTDTYLAGSTVAIIAAIAIAVFLILRRK